MRTNHVVDPQQAQRHYPHGIAAKRLTLKDYEALSLPLRGISKRLLRAIRGHIGVFVE